jgi:hypothetical protein
MGTRPELVGDLMEFENDMWKGWEAELTRRIGKVTSEKGERKKKKGVDEDLWLVIDGSD